MRIILPLCLFFAINAYFVSIFNLSFAKAFPFALITSNLIIYISGLLFRNFRIGFYLLIFLCFISALYVLYQIIIKKDKSGFIKLYFSNGFLFSILMYVFVVIVNWNRGFNYIDEYCFWGFLPKEAFRLNDFYFSEESFAWFNTDYPPFYSLFEMLWCYCCNSFKDSYCYQAISYFSLSLLIPLFDIKHIKNSLLKSSFLFLSIISLGLVINYTKGMVYETLFYNSIYVDLHIGFLVGFILYLLFTFDFNKTSCYLFYLLSLLALILTKQISVMFVILLYLSLVIKMMINKHFSSKNLLYLIVILAVLFIFKYSWTWLLQTNNVHSKFTTSSFDYFVIFRYLVGKTNLYETDIINRFIYTCFTRPILIKPFKLSYVTIVLLLSLILFLILKPKNSNNKKSLLIALCYLIFGIIYAYAMLCSYIYGFSESEGPGLIMFDRYMMTCVVAGLVLCFQMLNYFFNKSYTQITCLIAILLSTNSNTLINSSPVFKYNGKQDFFSQRFNDLLYQYDISNNLIIIEQGDVLKSCILRYSIDKKINYNDLDLVIDDCKDEESIKKIIFDKLNNYDYVYLAFVDDRLISIWNLMNDDEPKQDHLYKIIQENNYIKLKACFNDW